MNYLIIIAHPNPKSFSHIIANTITTTLSQNLKNNIKTLDLYDHKQGYLQMNETNRIISDPDKQYMQDMISWADYLIFCFPIWWMDCPAILKNRLDVNFENGFSYKYEKGKAIGLLNNKKASIYATAGAPWWLVVILYVAFRMVWTRGRLGYSGMQVAHTYIIGNMNSLKTIDSRNYILEYIRGIYSKI